MKEDDRVLLNSQAYMRVLEFDIEKSGLHRLNNV